MDLDDVRCMSCKHDYEEPEYLDIRRLPPQNLFEKLCDQFDLSPQMTTKDQLLNHIKSLI